MSLIQNQIKIDLRKTIKKTLKALSAERKRIQSQEITKKVTSSDAFKNSQKISIYLSTENEVSTVDILSEIFKHRKEVFVPSYQGNSMEMLRLKDMQDYEQLPLTKWNIKQPEIDSNRENALATGGLDLILVPGVGFSEAGGRIGHGRGYYDKYFKRYFELYPDRYSCGTTLYDKIISKKTILMGLAFKEQMIDKGALPLESHDFQIDVVVTADS